jgi:DNA modification methylase
MDRNQKTSYNQQELFKNEILEMPEGYYSGDKPNPNLHAFVNAHIKERPYDPTTDNYDIPAFDHPIETTKATAIYNMHTYWSKKPHDAIRQYIQHYTQPGDLVLDPFCGSGGTALAALMDGRKAIAIDRSPAATFIAKSYCTPVDVDELQVAFEELKKKVKPEIDWLYETKCDRCGGKATTAYTIYSQVFQCTRCLNKVPLFDCREATSETRDGRPKKVNACPYCYDNGIIEEISTRGDRFGAVPVMVSYICECGCRPVRGERRHNDPDPVRRDHFEKYDLGKLREIEAKEIPYWYPKDRMMHAPADQDCWGVEWRPGRNFRTVDELFTKRNLWALAAILRMTKDINPSTSASSLLFIFTSNLLKASKMMAHNSDGIGRIQKGTYYMPQILHDINVWRFFEDTRIDFKNGYMEIILKCNNLLITTMDARYLTIANNSIDYIFTDPPYAEKVQYGELNFIWEAWLGLDTHWHDEEIIVNEVRGKSLADWTEMMRQAMSECYRVLKPGRWLSLCYHDTSEGTWELIQDIMAGDGFIADKSDSALFIDTGQKSFNQLNADKVNKRDLVINFRKPRTGEAAAHDIITGDEDETTFAQKVHTIIRDYLTSHPGTTKDRVYDEVVSCMVRAGQMEAHNFDELLGQVADEVREPVLKNLFEKEELNLFGTHEISRWYMKETELAVHDAAESAKEDAAAFSVNAFISDWLKKHPGHEGVHYSDIFEHYVYTVTDKPRRQLYDWLPDYFYITPEGTYRLPADEEETILKEHGRASGTNRRIKRYISYLQQGLIVPENERPSDSTLIEWIRHCKQSGLNDQGVFLYERGGLNLDSLPEEIMVRVEEDYQVCRRMLDKEHLKNRSKKA